MSVQKKDERIEIRIPYVLKSIAKHRSDEFGLTISQYLRLLIYYDAQNEIINWSNARLM